MSDPIINQAIQQATDQAAQQGANTPQPQADEASQAEFEQALNGTQEADASQQVDAATNDPSKADAAQQKHVHQAEESEHTTPSLGDAILEGVEKMKSSHDARADRIENQLLKSEGKEMSVQDCIKLQFEVMQMSLEQDVTGKIADKTSQGVQTLFRNQ